VQEKVMIPPVVIAAILITGGALLVFVSQNQGRNSVTKALFRLCTLMPRAAFSDGTWVFLNGVGLISGGVLLLLLSLLDVIR
jgi:hypothetical protein